MIKTIWNPGDIITTEKWNKINNNLSILGAYQLPTIDPQNNNEPIIINKSYDEIYKLLKQGVICYFITEQNHKTMIKIISKIDNDNKKFYYNYSDNNSITILNENQMQISTRKK